MTATDWRVTWYHTDHGRRCVIAGDRGRVYLSVIAIDDAGVRLDRVPLESERHMAPLSTEYPVRRAARRMLAAGHTLGITEPARRALRALAQPGEQS